MTHDRFVVFLIAVTIGLAGCERKGDSHAASESRPLPPVAADAPTANASTRAGLQTAPALPVHRESEPSDPVVETSREPQYVQIGRARGFSYAGIPRWELRIEIQRGHTRDEVGSIIEAAARATIAQRGGRAAEVLAFAPGDDTSGMATIGQGVFAPNGKWGDAGKDGPMVFRLTGLRDEYFRTPDELDRWVVGSTIALRSSDDRPIRLSNSRDRWDSESEVAAVSPGTEAVIVQRHMTPIASDMKLIRYEVEVEIEGQAIRGWVSQWAVEGI